MACTYRATINKSYRKNATGVYSIYVRVSLSGRSIYLAIDQKIENEYWTDSKDQWIKKTHPRAYNLNAIIRNEIGQLRDFEDTQIRFGNPVNLQSINKYFRSKTARTSFNEYSIQWINTIKGKELNTIKVYNTFLKHFNEFAPNTPFNQLTESLFHRFAAWLKEDKKLAGISVHKYFKPCRLICRQAFKDGLVARDPFYGVHISETVKSEKSKDRVFLTVDEITKIKNAELDAELAEIRKHFLFCFYAGCYYNDIKNKITWNTIKPTELGYCIVAARYKNENLYISPIYKFKGATEIIDGQKGLDPVWVFPNIISEQKYNAKLKELAKAVGINKNLMNKTARHSFTQLWMGAGANRSLVAKMLGHTKEATTKEYYELTIGDVTSQIESLNFQI